MKDNPFLNFTISSLNSIDTVRRIKGETLIVNQRFSYAVSFCLSGKIVITPSAAVKAMNAIIVPSASGQFCCFCLCMECA